MLTTGVTLESGRHVQVQRFAETSGLLSAVHDGNALDSGRDGSHEMLRRPRSEKLWFQDPHLVASPVEERKGLLNDGSAGPHDNEHVLSIGWPCVVKQRVLTSSEFCQLLHLLHHDARDFVVSAVGRFEHLEIHVGVLVGASDVGVHRVQCPRVVCMQSVKINHFLHVGVRHHLSFLNVVGNAEPVKEMHKRHTGPQSGQMRN